MRRGRDEDTRSSCGSVVCRLRLNGHRRWRGSRHAADQRGAPRMRPRPATHGVGKGAGQFNPLSGGQPWAVVVRI
jgi:hypothetical protein